jgi:F0F1-type ATP synthase assembly protein I
VISKNPFRQLAYAYRGSPWILWMLALTQALLAVLFLFPERHSTPISLWIGAVCALIAICYFVSIAYYLTHRAELAANPEKPIFYTAKTMIWIVAFTLVIIAVFTLLELFVWRS